MKRLGLMLLLLLVAPFARAHVGSKDVFETVHPGPYTLYVTVRPPNVIPGVATVEVRSSGAEIRSLQVVPLPVTGEAAKHPPAADAMQRSSADPAFFTGAVWLMAGGTWQLRFTVDGVAGTQQASVPVVAVPVSMLRMDKGMAVTLGVLGLFLVLSMAGIIGAAVRESRLRPGESVPPEARRMGWWVTAASLALLVGIVLFGAKWWNVEAAGYADRIYKPAPTQAILSGNDLLLKLGKRPEDPRARRNRPAPLPEDRFLLDHGKIMHLYAIRMPEMDAAFHLHPELEGKDAFRISLPQMPPGNYQLYGDVVHANGFPETLLATVNIPAEMKGTALASDDASGLAKPLSAGDLPTTDRLPDGYEMVWDKPGELRSGTAYLFHFHLLDGQGKPAQDVEPYLGMAGHAAFVKTDGTVFAHTHPEGSAAMADVMLADESLGGKMPEMAMNASGKPLPAEVTFPYGFPSPGRYRIFIQMKHGSTVETGVFDAEVK